MAMIPKPTAPIAGGLLVAPEWWNYLRQLSAGGDTTALAEAIERVQQELAELQGAGGRGDIRTTRPILSQGTLATGLVQLSLEQLPDAGGGELLKIVRDEFGRVAGTSQAVLADLADVSPDAPVLGDALQWTGTQWEPKAIELGVNNLDGGRANSTYGGTTAINGGGA